MAMWREYSYVNHPSRCVRDVDDEDHISELRRPGSLVGWPDAKVTRMS